MHIIVYVIHEENQDLSIWEGSETEEAEINTVKCCKDKGRLRTENVSSMFNKEKVLMVTITRIISLEWWRQKSNRNKLRTE